MDGSQGRADFSAIIIAASKRRPGYLALAEIAPDEIETFMDALYSALVENPALHSFVRLAVRAADKRREHEEA